MRILIFFIALVAHGQFFGPPTRFRQVTVATLPSGVSSGYTVQVTDGASAGDCTTGGGSSVAWCRYNGSSWEPIGDGGSGGGGGAPTSASYLTLGTNGTLTSERVFTAGSGLTCTDAGAGSTYTCGPDTAVMQSKSNLQSGATLRCASASGTDDYKCTMTPTLTAYTDGMVVEFEATATANTGAATLEIDSLGGGSSGVAIKKCDGSTNPDNSDIAVGRQIALRYDGTVFRLPCNPATVSGSSGVADPGSNGIPVRTGSGTAVARSITAGSGITVTNGDGVSGNPTIASTKYSYAVANTTATMTGSDVTVATFSNVPALPANACLTISTALLNVGASWDTKIKVDGTTVFTLHSGIISDEGMTAYIKYCNTTAQSAQHIVTLYQGYSSNANGLVTAGSSVVGYFGNNQLTAATNNIDWSTSHTITITGNASSGTYTVGLAEVHN